MKSIAFATPIFIILVTMISCSAGELALESASTNVSAVPQTDIKSPVDELSAADCPKAKPGARQLIDASRGICFLYPDTFDVNEYGDGLGYTLAISSLMANHQSPVIWLTFEPANGLSLEELTDQRLAEYAFPETKAQMIILGNEPARMLDNLPGQDTNRRVVAIHDDSIIEILIDHIGTNYGVAGATAEAAYNMITSSFQFIGKVPEAPLANG